MLKQICCNSTIAFLLILLAACDNRKTSDKTLAPKPVATDTAALQIKTSSAYDSLRNAALNTNSGTLELPITDTTVYGIVMDWETGGGIVTIVAYLNGDAGSYTSANDQVISKGHYKSVIKSAIEFVNKAQQYLPKAQKTTDFSLPQKNHANFYFLTKNGIFKASEDMKNFDNDTSPWQPLFDKGNEVSASLRFLKN